jgi:hypothetical protein
MLSIYLIVCVQKSICFILFFFRSIILCTFLVGQGSSEPVAPRIFIFIVDI